MLFLISFVLILIASYLLSSILDNKSFAKGFIYTVLICFSQIIFTAELLSIFNQFKPVPFLSLNVICLVIVAYFWNKAGKPRLELDVKTYFNRLKNVFLKDKLLFILALAWTFFVIVSIFLCLISTVTNGDAKSYHVVRSAYWVLNSSINHFDSANIRNLIFPINSEIVYAWIILFTKKVLFLGFLSFAFYCVYITSLYKIVQNILGYSLRKTLWVIFIISSFAGTIVYTSSTETDLIIASLVLTGIYLYWDSVKAGKKLEVFMSSLCFALAIGTKTSAGFLIPASGLFLIYLSIKYKNIKSFLMFLFYGLINFLIFSSYNYILNFIDFRNIFGFEGAIIAHKNLYGIKGCLASLIRHFFLFFDFTGFRWENLFGQNIVNLKFALLNTFGLSQIPEGLYSSDRAQSALNNTLSESLTGCGLLGFILYLPCLAISIITPIFKRNKKYIYNFSFALIFLISFITMSYLIAYMAFNVRFLNSIILVSAPILVLSYTKNNKNIFKYIIVLIACFYLTCVSTHLWARPLNKIVPALMNKTSISDIHYTMDCLNWETKEPNYDEMCKLEALIDYNFNDINNKILFFANSSEFTLRFLLKDINGAHFDIKLINELDNININDYNIIIIPKQHQDSTFIKNYSSEKIKYEIIQKQNNQFKILFDNPKAQYACLYTDVNRQFITKISNKIPYNEFCNFSEYFYKKYALEPVTDVGKYVFFVNKNNLPHTNRIY